MQEQLLDLFSTPQTFANFIPLGNEMLCECLISSDNQFIHIIGTPQSGKTHLLKAWVSQHQKNNSIYLDQTFSFNPSNIENLTQAHHYIAIDNVDLLDINSQIVVFDLFNHIKLQNLDIKLLTSSCNNLDVIKTFRSDLRTRLLSGIKLHLKALDDDHLLDAIQTYSKQNGISLTLPDAKFILSRCPRNLGALIGAIDKIANDALLKNKKITQPFIKNTLSI